MTVATATATQPVWVIGAGGMLAGELLRLLADHPALELSGAVTRHAGEALATLHPHHPGSQRTTGAADAAAGIAADLERTEGRVPLFLGLPHGESATLLPTLLSEVAELAGPEAAERLAVVDLAADFRIADPARYAAAYGQPHPAPDWIESFAYGLPEWNRAAVCASNRVAAPGCFATALQLAVLPAADAGMLDPQQAWVLHAVTGSSGSGKHPKPGTHHPHRHGNFWAYGLDGHRHQAELEQALEAVGPIPPIHFLPHSGPFARGIHLTAALPLAAGADDAAVQAIFADAYAGCPFVEVLADGVPDLRRVVGSNRASVAVSVRGRVLTVLLTLDNLLKGGAGQALQCMNLMLGLPETAGLPRCGLGTC